MSESMKTGYEILEAHCVFTTQTMVFMLAKVKEHRPNFTLEESLLVVNEIVNANFPKCLDKYFKGEEWRLE